MCTYLIFRVPFVGLWYPLPSHIPIPASQLFFALIHSAIRDSQFPVRLSFLFVFGSPTEFNFTFVYEHLCVFFPCFRRFHFTVAGILRVRSSTKYLRWQWIPFLANIRFDVVFAVWCARSRPCCECVNVTRSKVFFIFSNSPARKGARDWRQRSTFWCYQQKIYFAFAKLNSAFDLKMFQHLPPSVGHTAHLKNKHIL